MKQFLANETNLMSYIHQLPPKMTCLRLYRITNESTEIENKYSSLKMKVALAVEFSIVCLGLASTKSFFSSSISRFYFKMFRGDNNIVYGSQRIFFVQELTLRKCL